VHHVSGFAAHNISHHKRLVIKYILQRQLADLRSNDVLLDGQTKLVVQKKLIPRTLQTTENSNDKTPAMSKHATIANQCSLYLLIIMM